ncbi:conserved hypothetical protein [Oleispira antarctica RB-8]|uniref:Uncharacterized protein n=1 Tax=Oleispira antarctica RB-8 TaxID=698738 RepID=R4YME0_OLEAN|nr:conserved hypothetical protein [Oleispira antarctica RB-8]
MRFRVTSSTLLAFLLSVSSISQADIQLDAGFASEYVRDGIKQSKAKPVIQLDGIYTSQLGFYGGAWLSGVERGSPDSTRFELDGFAGWYIPFTSFLAVDLGYTRATFLGDAQATKQAYGEGFFNLLLNDATTFGYRLADDYMGSGESLQTLELAHTVNSGEFGFEFSTRQYRYLNTTEDVNWGSESRDNYFHFRIGVARNYFQHNLGLSLEKTNLSSEFDGSTQIIFTYSRAFSF